MHVITVETQKRTELVDITDRVRQAVAESGVRNGSVLLYVPHTTAGITINENADPTVKQDILSDLDRLVPASQSYYRHLEGNSDSHVKASLMGHSAMLLVEDRQMVLGTWQGVFFCEFDGPRRRKVRVQVAASRPQAG